MHFSDVRGRLWIGAMALALAFFLAAIPGRADTTRTVTTVTVSGPVDVNHVCFPATVTRVESGDVVLDSNGASLTLPLSCATFEIDGSSVPATALAPGEQIMVMYPHLHGHITALNGNMLCFTASNGNALLIPSAALTSDLYADKVWVRLSDGNFVMVPLSTAMYLQNTQNATIVGEVPADGKIVVWGSDRLNGYTATGDDVESPRVRDINFSEGLLIQQDTSKLIQDQSIDGDCRF